MTNWGPIHSENALKTIENQRHAYIFESFLEMQVASKNICDFRSFLRI